MLNEHQLELIFKIHSLYDQKQDLNAKILNSAGTHQNSLHNIKHQLFDREDDDELDEEYKETLIREIHYQQQLHNLQNRTYGGGCTKLLNRGPRKGQACGKYIIGNNRCISHPITDEEQEELENKKIKERIELENKLQGQIQTNRQQRQKERQEKYDLEVYIAEEKFKKTIQYFADQMNKLTTQQQETVTTLSKHNKELASLVTKFEEDRYSSHQKTIIQKIEVENLLRQEKIQKQNEMREALQKLPLLERLKQKKKEDSEYMKGVRERLAKRDAEKEQQKQEFMKKKGNKIEGVLEENKMECA